MRHPLILTAVLLCGTLLFGFGCDNSGTRGDGAGGDGAGGQQIAVIAKSTVNAFWKAVEAGARQAADDLNVQIIWTGPDAETRHTQQADMVDNMVNRGVDGIVLAPTHFTALVRPVESAVGRGVPVVIIDSPLDSESPVSVVATDNYAAGQEAAEALIAAIGENRAHGGKVLMLQFLEGSGSTEQREQGFRERIEQEEGLTLANTMYIRGSGSTTDAADTADALLRRHISGGQLQVDGVFASNQPTAIGMLRKIEQFEAQGVEIEAAFVGFDSHDVLLAGIRDGKIAALVVQDPFRMGYLGVQTMAAHLKGEEIESFVNTGAMRVTAENIDEPEVRKVTLQE